MNYGETLAYWYLRLNGFFPLVDFVLHHPDKTAKYKHSADTDLLAIRFPNAYEKMGNRVCELDIETFESWKLDLQHETIGLIVEVKTSKSANTIEAGARQAFKLKRLVYGVQRIGLWQNKDATKIAKKLEKDNFYRDPKGRSVVAKLLISDVFPNSGITYPCLTLPLAKADQFIQMRMHDHLKLSDRMFFPSDLMQYIIWRQANNL